MELLLAVGLILVLGAIREWRAEWKAKEFALGCAQAYGELSRQLSQERQAEGVEMRALYRRLDKLFSQVAHQGKIYEAQVREIANLKVIAAKQSTDLAAAAEFIQSAEQRLAGMVEAYDLRSKSARPDPALGEQRVDFVGGL